MHRANSPAPAGWLLIRLALGSFMVALLTGCASGTLAPVLTLPSPAPAATQVSPAVGAMQAGDT
ncbi:MAG: hypothetical protein ACKO3Q_12300, partial [Betaproteobacteria bacterium]